MIATCPWVALMMILVYGVLLVLALRMLPDRPEAKLLKRVAYAAFLAPILLAWAKNWFSG